MPAFEARKLLRFVKRLVRAGAALAIVAGAAGGGLLAWLGRDLPRFDRLVDYQPKEATRVFAADGSPVAVFAEERRTVVPPADIPDVLRKAILAAEDAQFYEHEGLDYTGIARAFVKNVLSGETRQGASTITQQVVKTFLLSPERTYTRKLKEMILARRLERNLTKDEILYLYLNQIYFGHLRYGVEEASRLYFGKGVRDVSLGEAALLAGLPQSPARLSPFDHPDRAKRRQVYVLDQMLANGFISQTDRDRELARPLVLAERPKPQPGPYYSEDVRRTLVATYGEEAVLTGGLQVTIAMDPGLQRVADAALHEALLGYERRHGYRGTLGALAAEDADRARRRYEKIAAETPGRRVLVDVRTGKARVLADGLLVAGRVEKVQADAATIWFGGPEGRLAAAEARWAKKPLPELLPVGEVVLVEVISARGETPALRLAQEPVVQGALVAVEPGTRRVRALVGGWDFKASSFDRATQARRQPGSAFKPFVYGAALESGRWTPGSLVVDAPETFRDPWTGKEWKPQNYDDAFEGTLTLRRAVALSKNTVPVRIVSELGVDPVVDFSRRAGVRTELPRTLTLALGTGEVTPLELANSFATFAAQGVFAEPVLIERVRARDGKLLEETSWQPRQEISPAVAYLVTSLLRAVIQEGTGQRAAELARPAAGKTGTTSDGRDAWFAGYTPDLAAVSWVGFDDHRRLGPGEAGARTALPAWLELMRQAHSGRPIADFPVPEGIELADIDPATGLLAAEGAPAERTPFLAGTAPTVQATAPGKAADDVPTQLFLEGSGGEP